MLHLQVIEFLFEAADDFVDFIADRRRVDLDPIVNAGEFAQQRLGDLPVRRDDDFTRLGVDHVKRNLFAEQNVAQSLGQLFAQLLGLGPVVVFDLFGVPFGLRRGDFRAVLVRLFLGRNLYIHHDPVSAGGHFQGRVLHVRCLFAEDGAEQTLFRRQFGLGLGCDFADENIPRLDLGADANHTVQAEVFERLLAEVGNVARDFLRPQLGVARADFKLLDVNRGKDVILDDSLADQDRVFEVVTVPGHKGDQHVAAERQLAAARAGAVGNDLAFLHRVALADENLLVDAGGRVGAHEFSDMIDVDAFLRRVPDLLLALRQFAVLREDDLTAGDGRDFSALFGRDHRAGIARHTFFQPRRNQRRFGDDQRHRLALHVRAHQRAVGVVVLQEGNQAGGDRHQLFRRHVHVIHSRRLDVDEIAFAAAGHAVGEKVAPLVDLRVGLRDDKRLLAVGGEVFEVSRHAAFFHLAVRRFNETKVVDACERGQRRDQADVRPFRRFDRANAPVVGRMHVAHLEPGPVA